MIVMNSSEVPAPRLNKGHRSFTLLVDHLHSLKVPDVPDPNMSGDRGRCANSSSSKTSVRSLQPIMHSSGDQRATVRQEMADEQRSNAGKDGEVKSGGSQAHISAAPVDLGSEEEQMMVFLEVVHSPGYEKSTRWTAESVLTLADLSKYTSRLLAEMYRIISDDKYFVPDALYKVVADAIVDRAYIDPSYCKAAAVVCEYISAMEVKKCCTAIPDFKFRMLVLDKCKSVMDVAKELREYSVRRWGGFVVFLTELCKLHSGTKLARTRQLIIDCLYHLSRPPCCANLFEVLILRHVLRTVGRDLSELEEIHMTQIVQQMRHSSVIQEPDAPATKLLLRCLLFCDAGLDVSVRDIPLDGIA